MRNHRLAQGRDERRTVLAFGSAVLVVCALMWVAEWMFPKSNASAIVLVTITVGGICIVRPGWNLRLGRFRAYWLALYGLLGASAIGAAWCLTYFKIPLPYDVAKLNVAVAAPAIGLITGIEESLFRQLMYRWLERRQVAARLTVIITALAFGYAHLGPVFIGSSIGATFYLLQSTYMVWIGLLLGELRHATGSWLMPWFGHFGYNIAVLYFLQMAY